MQGPNGLAGGDDSAGPVVKDLRIVREAESGKPRPGDRRSKTLHVGTGVLWTDVQTQRWDGVPMSFVGVSDALTLGNVVSGVPRAAFWTFKALNPGPKFFTFRVWSENGGEITLTQTVQVGPPPAMPDLVETAMTVNPPTPIRAPGTSFAVTDTVQNAGMERSGSLTTRYYLSLDGVKSAEDTLLAGNQSVHGLDAGASHTGTATVTIPVTTAPNAYFLLACADDKNAVAESNEGNNCIASSTAIVTVARPDLVETTATTNPPTPVRAPGTTFSVTDTVQNVGPAASGSSTTRYYLIDPTTALAPGGTGRVLLTGSRTVPVLAAGANHSGTVTVTIPPATPLKTYFLTACADDLSVVTEVKEDNNCLVSTSLTVTVTRPDLVESTVSAPPASKARGTTFPVTDTVQNVGGVASGPSTTRYYLSLDAVKSAGDTLLTGSRGIPALAAGASHSGTVTVTIAAATPPNTYFVLVCADAASAVVETDETNNCKPSSGTVTVTP